MPRDDHMAKPPTPENIAANLTVPEQCRCRESDTTASGLSADQQRREQSRCDPIHRRPPIKLADQEQADDTPYGHGGVCGADRAARAAMVYAPPISNSATLFQIGKGDLVEAEQPAVDLLVVMSELRRNAASLGGNRARGSRYAQARRCRRCVPMR
jgi:hypothetical protein